MKEQLRLFQEDSLANPSASLESGKARRTNAIYGTKCLEQFKRLSPNSSSQKTSMVSSILTGEWYSSKCALTWKMKGTKSNRLLFQLAPKTLRTEETEFGLLPTPSAMIVGDVDMQKLDERREREKKRLKNGNGFGKSLPELAKKGLLPTPSARDYKDNVGSGKDAPSIGKTRGYSLGQKINSLLSTPRARDIKGARSEEALKKSGRTGTNSLPDHFAQTGKSSQLSPHFVGEMMGFPKDWTVSPFLSGAENPLKPTETQ